MVCRGSTNPDVCLFMLANVHMYVCVRERKRPGGSPGLVFLAGEASAPLLTSEKDAVLLELGVWGGKKKDICDH